MRMMMTTNSKRTMQMRRLPYGTKMRAVSGSRRFGKLWNLKIDIGFQ